MVKIHKSGNITALSTDSYLQPLVWSSLESGHSYARAEYDTKTETLFGCTVKCKTLKLVSNKSCAMQDRGDGQKSHHTPKIPVFMVIMIP